MDEYAIVHFSLCKTIGFLAIFLHEMHETCCKIVRKLQPREYTQGRRNGGQGGDRPPLDFGRSVNPIPTGEQIMPTTLLLIFPRIFRLSYGPDTQEVYI